MDSHYCHDPDRGGGDRVDRWCDLVTGTNFDPVTDHSIGSAAFVRTQKIEFFGYNNEHIPIKTAKEK